MGITPDRQPGPREEEELQFDDRGPGGDNDGDPTVEGALRRVTNVLRYFVNGAVSQIARWKNPPTGFDDIDLNGITNGQGIAYNSTTKQFAPHTFAGGYDSATHRAEDQLVHEIAEDSYTETEETAGKTTAVRTYTDSGKTLKIREEEYTYTGGKVTTIVTKQYDGAGTLVETYTETLTYSGADVDTITGVLS